jgi:C1A family cysteine protease
VAAVAGLPDPPPAADWTNRDSQSFVEPVRHQGMVNACLAYAVAGLVGAQARIEAGIPRQAADGFWLPGLSARQLFLSGPQEIWAGQAALEALAYTAEVGLVPVYEEDRLIHFLGGHLDETLARSVTKVRRVVVFSRHQTALAKVWLAHRGPLLVTLVLPQNLDLLLYREGVYRPTSAAFLVEGGHSCVVVGYDDTRQAWKVQNSWGTDWGEAGYFWIAYGACYLESQMIGIDGVEVFLAPPGRSP